ncbi:signal peptidase I [Leeia oryzae]|uniref:signal peptidase I n=1 Tax=Leeia oryzae TaxID=356662 RepID=UPI00038269B1|nr:signal peptidase I [Leeia oryzae]
MNWMALWSGAFVLGVVLLVVGRRSPRQESGEAPAALQFGYMALVVGAFGMVGFQTSLALAMLLFVLVSGFVWGWDKWVLAKKRTQGQRQHDGVELLAGLFPIIAVVFVVRSFLFEPFTIPSSSMRPGLVPGDFILVNRFAYGVRVPVSNKVMVDTGKPARGDVMVFHYPPEPGKDFIKRVVGLPGDEVEYRNKQLTINHVAVKQEWLADSQYARDGQFVPENVKVYKESLGVQPSIIQQRENEPTVYHAAVQQFPFRENCNYDVNDEWFRCKVPAGHYFMMGDNRDDSSDGRYWGFVSDDLIVGKAVLIWFNWPDFKRIGTVIH